MVKPSSSASRIAGNTSWLLGGELLGRLLSFVAVLHLTHALSAGALGAVELGLAIFGFVQMVTLGGLDVLVTRKIGCPTLVLWGTKGVIPKWYDALGVWKEWASDVQGEEIDSGHMLAEEAPDATYEALRKFFG